MKKSIIFIDLDGTTLDKKVNNKYDTISKENLEYIKEVQKYAKVVVSTGRAANEKTLKIIEPINKLDLVYWNGAGIIADGKQIASYPMNIDEVKIFYDFALKNRLNLIVNSNKNNSFYSNKLLLFGAKKILGHNANKLEDFNFDQEFFKLFTIGANNKLNNKIIDFVNQKLPNWIAVTSGEHSQFVEITHKNAQKGLANVKIAEYYGIELENTYHVGDSMNDSTCARKVGTLIAMKNSPESLKKIADIISPYSFKKAGLAKTLELIINKLK